MSVPMSLDHVSLDDYHDIEMIPINMKDTPFGDDACALSLLKVKINKAAMSIDDGYAISGDEGYVSMDEQLTRIPRKKGKLVSSIHDPYAILSDGCGTMDDLRRRIRKQKKVMSLDVDDDDDDDDDDFKNVQRKIRKIASLDDVLTARVTFTEEDKTQNKISVDDLTLTCNEISDDDLTLPCSLFEEMSTYLPAMAATFIDKDWSLLRKFCFRIEPENLSFEEAIKFELVATCIWFLLSETCPLHVKVGVSSALQFILSSAPKATSIPIDQEEGVDHAPMKMSIDQAYFDAIVVEALSSGDEEILRQVCWAIIFIGIFRQTETVGTSIQNQLLKLARNFPFSSDTNVVTFVLITINYVHRFLEDSFMKKRLLESVHSDREWLLNIMRDPDEELVKQSYLMLMWITGGKYDDELFVALLYDIIPSILKRCSRGVDNCLRICAAKVISNVINGAASSDHVEALVIDSDCIRRLLSFLFHIRDEDTINVVMEAFENILKAGEKNDSGVNFYLVELATLCDGEYRKFGGWSLLDNDAPNSEDLLLKYAPLKWLRRNPRFSVILCDLGLDDFRSG